MENGKTFKLYYSYVRVNIEFSDRDVFRSNKPFLVASLFDIILGVQLIIF